MSIGQIIDNKILWAIVASGLSTQLLKAFASIIWEGRLNWHRTLEPGGMPSSHAASAATLLLMVGYQAGFNSLLFTVCLYIAFVVMYDAAGVRRAVGKQAILLNRILSMRTLQKRTGGAHLKELLGHTPVEVFVGALIGIAWALFFHYVA
ncbi:MAG TPA: divergent PAP2 family protein [Candidatus Edwardsbacteria bacterium]|nr:divergent PAP2 family protein [Candidatus Edwardsbacteria bacterium]